MNWVHWFRTFDQPVPPGTMVPFAFGVAAILLKAVDLIVAKRKSSPAERPGNGPRER